jgi:hypothetical protein
METRRSEGLTLDEEERGRRDWEKEPPAMGSFENISGRK